MLTGDDIKLNIQPRRLSTIDIISAEIVFSSNALLVEGLDDANILRSFMSENQMKLNFEILGHGADGAEKIRKWMKALDKLGIKSAAIYDGDKSVEYDLAVKEYGSENVYKWSTVDIRDKPCFDHKAVDASCTNCKYGLFDDAGRIKAGGSEEVIEVLNAINDVLGSS